MFSFSARRFASQAAPRRMAAAAAARAAAASGSWNFRKAFANTAAFTFATGATMTVGAALCDAIPCGLGSNTPPFDFVALRQDILNLLEDEIQLGPLFVRLAWHEAGTWDAAKQDGSPNSASMMFAPECFHAANNGLARARDVLEKEIRSKHPNVTHADLWSLAGCLAVEAMGGPHVPWRWGRRDAQSGAECAPDGRLPDATQGASHIRQVFGRMGFNEQETVALIGAHCVGHCHTENSGFSGPWTHDPFGFSNGFFTELLGKKWVINMSHRHNVQYEDEETKSLMMLPADMALAVDPEFRKWSNMYAESNDLFCNDFAKAFQKLLELGVSDNLFEVK